MKSFRIQCIVRVLLIGATLALAAYLLMQTEAYVAALLVTVVAGAQLVGLIRYVEWTNRELGRFVRSVRYSDFSQSFTGRGRGASFEELEAAFSEVMDDFREARAEKEEHYRYLQTVMQHVGVGLISFRQDGHVGLVNNAAKQMLRVHRLKYVQALGMLSDELVAAMLRLRAGEKTLVKVYDDDELLQISIQATEFKLRGDLYKLVSLQNIQSELEEKELEAWQKLTRVLTHEIMNSMTPIASLAATADGLLAEVLAGEHQNGTDPDVQASALDAATRADVLHDVHEAVQTIERRSQRLHSFVNAYRSLTRIPQPNLQIITAAELLEDVVQLLRPQMQGQGIAFTCRIEPDTLNLTADPELVEQVLINLLKNAMQALEGMAAPRIALMAYVDERARPTIQVQDNGPGIAEEALSKVFIPFFTTKKEGSGIGLSLSRQIMRLHGGTITVRSTPGSGTTFTLRF